MSLLSKKNPIIFQHHAHYHIPKILSTLTIFFLQVLCSTVGVYCIFFLFLRHNYIQRHANMQIKDPL